MGEDELRIERVFAMPEEYTFKIDSIRRLLREEMDGNSWLDPMAGFESPAQVTNDINPGTPTRFHEDALQFLGRLPVESFDGVLFDPPYSWEMARRHYGLEYKDTATFTQYITKCLDAIAPLIRAGGKAICFGWSSSGLGWGRGFSLYRMLVVNHGAIHRDTLVTVERKMQKTLVNL